MGGILDTPLVSDRQMDGETGAEHTCDVDERFFARVA